ncbi:hypothetical protein HPB50_014980 [Hyalomma asiaticum]|uniref:Uncharacterized protein n=1 Tax=Hyalomma asiaticum TaxID=266040 RepID=A0ACB7SYH6_HYAAI|nr:hypothetical protein HPB50_014980 [Hyalomma asiaticum]
MWPIVGQMRREILAFFSEELLEYVKWIAQRKDDSSATGDLGYQFQFSERQLASDATQMGKWSGSCKEASHFENTASLQRQEQKSDKIHEEEPEVAWKSTVIESEAASKEAQQALYASALR